MKFLSTDVNEVKSFPLFREKEEHFNVPTIIYGYFRLPLRVF